MEQKNTLPPVDVVEKKLSEKGASVMFTNVKAAFVSLASPNTKFADKDELGPVGGTYEMTLLIPKSNKAFVDKFYKIIDQAVKLSVNLKKPEEKEKALKIAKDTGADGALLKDGNSSMNADGQVYDGFAEHYAIKVKSNAVRKPEGGFAPKVAFKVYRADKSVIRAHEIADECYSGAWFDVAVNLTPYKHGVNSGVAAYIQGVMKLKDDERLGAIDPFSVREDIQVEKASEEEVGFGGVA